MYQSEGRERDFLRTDSFFRIGGREVSDGQAQSEFGLDRISEFGLEIALRAGR
jgi:hypothetical protein